MRNKQQAWRAKIPIPFSWDQENNPLFFCPFFISNLTTRPDLTAELYCHSRWVVAMIQACKTLRNISFWIENQEKGDCCVDSELGIPNIFFFSFSHHFATKVGPLVWNYMVAQRQMLSQNKSECWVVLQNKALQTKIFSNSAYEMIQVLDSPLSCSCSKHIHRSTAKVLRIDL